MAKQILFSEAARKKMKSGVDQIKEKHYDVRSFRWIEDCIQDVRFSARMLSRSPGYAFASILILAMAIGPNAAVFSLFRGVLYNAMPYSNSDRLVQINSTHQMASIPFGVSYPDYLDFVKYSRSFDEIGVFANANVDLNGTGEPERLKAIRVSSSIFKVLKRELLIGRPFNANDDLPEAGGVAILSHGLWMRKFSSDSSILGMKISIDRVPHTIIGVMPADVVFTESRDDFLLPLRVDIGKASRQTRDYYPLARLKKGVSVEQARGELSGIAASLEREQVFTNYGVGATVQELGKNYSTNENRLGFQFGFLSVTFVLLIACSNISTLLLARASGRGREFAVRASLGAARTRLVRQLLTESALLALFGAFIGMFLAQGWLKIMLAVSPSDMPNKDVMRVDSASFVYTALIALLSSLIFGIVPALRSTGRQTIDAIKREEHATTGRSRRRVSFVVCGFVGFVPRRRSGYDYCPSCFRVADDSKLPTPDGGSAGI